MEQHFTTQRNKKGHNALNERLIVEYLHNLSSDQLLDVRKKCFKLALDHYVEIALNKIALKPYLKDIESEDFPSKYVFKCNIMKDVVECLDYVIANSTLTSLSSTALGPSLPERCVEFSVNNRLAFPLGKKSLTRQLDLVKSLRVKLLNYEDLVENLKAYESKMDKLEKSLIYSKSEIDEINTQNVFLKTCLTILLTILILMSFVFLLTNCLNKVTAK